MPQEYRKAFSLAGLTEKYTAATKASIEANFTRFAALIRSINPNGELPSASEDQMLVYVDGAWVAQDQPTPTPPAASPAWVLIATQVAAGASNYDFTGLSGYSEILVLQHLVTRSGAVTSALRVSTDNGATFLAAVGDYHSIDTAGAKTDVAAIGFFSPASAAARTGTIQIVGFNLAGAKDVRVTQPAAAGMFVIPTTTPLNAIRVLVNSPSTMDAGTFYVYGRV